jgi:hypothetical protein
MSHVDDQLLGKIYQLLFRIHDEAVPLFGSDRLRDVHADCTAIVRELAPIVHRTDHRSQKQEG